LFEIFFAATPSLKVFRNMAFYKHVRCGILHQAEARFEKTFEDFEFTKGGFEVRVQHFSFPRNETTTLDLVKKVLGKEPAAAGVMR
jgi:hypothetical protein